MRLAQPSCDFSLFCGVCGTAWLQLVLMRPKSGFNPHRGQLASVYSIARGYIPPLWLGLVCAPLGQGHEGVRRAPTPSPLLKKSSYSLRHLLALQRSELVFSKITCLTLSDLAESDSSHLLYSARTRGGESAL